MLFAMAQFQVLNFLSLNNSRINYHKKKQKKNNLQHCKFVNENCGKVEDYVFLNVWMVPCYYGHDLDKICHFEYLKYLSHKMTQT